jgi:hypothetical protein
MDHVRHRGPARRLAPIPFDVFLNPLFRLLTALGQGKGISRGLRAIDQFSNPAFADDITIIAEIRRLGDPCSGAQMLLNTIEAFSHWSEMEVTIVKSCGVWVGLRRQCEILPLKLSCGTNH